MVEFLRKLLENCAGVTAIECGLVTALVTVTAIMSLHAYVGPH